MNQSVNTFLSEAQKAKRKLLAVLIDPDKTTHLNELLSTAKNNPPDLFLVGGSLLHENRIEETITTIKKHIPVPVLLFPGSHLHLAPNADGLLLLSVTSGRNPDLLIGRHVLAAPAIQRSGIEIIPTGYLLIESGRTTAVSYMSQTTPIPNDKPEIAAATALAGQQLGLRCTYLEAGSGAQETVPEQVIKSVRSVISHLLIVGGGIRQPAQARAHALAGADIIVIGNALEQHPEQLPHFVHAIREA
ncbi:MAG: geranylgeranylglyceryl/heptaprenylglyceryl phosphate synthase [Bacteroidia bacterium]